MTAQPKPPPWCPRCLALTQDERACPRCGLPQTGGVAARLRVVVYRLHEVATEQRNLLEEQGALESERDRLLAQLEHEPLSAQPPMTVAPGVLPAAATAGRGAEWTADVVRTILLWVGGVLLAVAALIFAAFAWQRLDDAGRAGMLVATTVASAGTALALRERLRATADVFAALTLSLLLIDWLALRRAGVAADLDAPSWWAIGTALVAAAALAAGRVFTSPRWLMVLAGSTSAALAVFATADAAATTAVAFSVVASAGVLARVALLRWDGWAAASILIAIACASATAAAVGAVLAGMADADAPSLWLAWAAAATGVPAVVAAAFTRTVLVRDLLTGAATVAALCGGAIAWWVAVDAPWIAAAIAVTSSLVVLLAQVAPASVWRGMVGAAGLVLLGASLAVADVLAAAVLGPAVLAESAWEHVLADTVLSVLPVTTSQDSAIAAGIVVLAVAVSSGVLAVVDRYRHRRTSPGAVTVVAAILVPLAAAAILALTPLAAELSVAGALAATGLPAAASIVVVGLATRRGSLLPAAAGAVATASTAIPALGWALATEPGTLTFGATALVAAAGATWMTSADSAARRTLAAVAAAALVGLVVAAGLSAGARAEDAGTVAVCGAAVVLVAAASRRGEDGRYAEAVGILGALIGISLAWGGEVHRSIALTLLVPALAAPAVRSDRRWYLVGAAVVAVGATWSWLIAGDVDLLEAYTLPAAVGALAAGEAHRRTRLSASSWTTYGAAIAIAFGPSLIVSVGDGGVVRPVALTVAGGALAAVGSRRRLQAPLVLGAAVVLAVALDTLSAVAAEIPRWISVGLVGAMLVWLGATADRRLAQLRRTREHLESLERP